MSKINFLREPLWREALQDLWAFVKAEWKWIVFFAAVVAVEQRLLSVTYNFQDLADQIKQAKGNQDEIIKVITDNFPGIVFSVVTTIATTLVSVYIFTVRYLQRFWKGGVPTFGVKEFFYWLYRIVQKHIILVFPFFLFVIVFGILNSVSDSAVVQGVSSFIFFVLVVFWLLYFFCGVYLLYLVSPLALLRPKEPVLKVSATMTKDALLRVWWGSMMMIGIVFAVFFPLILIDVAIASALGLDVSQLRAFGTIIDGGIESATNAGMAVYSCVVYRTLSQEQAKKSV